MDTCMECHGILIPKNKKWSEKLETLLDLMSCHQDDVVKNWPVWGKFGHTPLTNWSNSLEGSWFREGKMHVCWRTGDSFLLRPSNFFLRLSGTNTTVMWKFGKFQGSFDLLKTCKWFSNHLMTVIRIWNTSTCNV